MSELTIRTNNVPRFLLDGYELTPKERKEVDYLTDAEIDESSARFFRYRGQLYDSHEFSRIIPAGSAHNGFAHTAYPDSPLLQWDGIQTDSYFSGIVIRWAKDDAGHTDFERVIVGLAMS